MLFTPVAGGTKAKIFVADMAGMLSAVASKGDAGLWTVPLQRWQGGPYDIAMEAVAQGHLRLEDSAGLETPRLYLTDQGMEWLSRISEN